MSKAQAIRAAKQVFQDHSLTIPVDIEKVARELGAELKKQLFDEDLSGFSISKDEHKFIGVNVSESDNRQRFTIAHEIGHLLLHAKKRVSYDQGVMMLRDSHSKDGTDLHEIEANTFAAELLMPETALRGDLTQLKGVDLMSSGRQSRRAIHWLANRYGVSEQAMTIRLTTLYFS